MKRFLASLFLLCASALPAPAQQGRDGAVITNSGSTNFSGYTIKVWTDGSAWFVHSRAGRPIEQPSNGSVDPELVQKLIQDAGAAKYTGTVRQTCVKSVSFGTSTVVQYHGWTSPDLDCPGGSSASALRSDAMKIAAALKVSGVNSRRIPMLPNEPRRAPVEGTPGQATPTPEHSPSAS